MDIVLLVELVVPVVERQCVVAASFAAAAFGVGIAQRMLDGNSAFQGRVDRRPGAGTRAGRTCARRGIHSFLNQKIIRYYRKLNFWCGIRSWIILNVSESSLIAKMRGRGNKLENFLKITYKSGMVKQWELLENNLNNDDPENVLWLVSILF